MTCTFFGHKDTPIQIEQKLRITLIELIENNDVRNFYIGNHGNFDNMVISVLKEIKTEFAHIQFYVVLAYMPTHKCEFPTILPEGIENIAKKGAIEYRNKWMVQKADFAITFIERDFGGASKFASLARKKCQKTINLAK